MIRAAADDLERTAERFGDYIKLERACSENTRRAYLSDLSIWTAWCRRNSRDPLDVQADAVSRFLLEAQIEGRKKSSVQRLGAVLRSFAKFLHYDGQTDKVPRLAPLPSREEKLPEILNENEIQRIINACEDGTALGKRDRAYIELAYGAGMRASELCGLRLRDLDPGSGILYARGKGDKERVVPILESVREKILHYLEGIRRQNICVSGEKALFLTVKGKRIPRITVYRIVRRELAEGGVQGKKSPHVLRHTFATHLMNGGADMREIQELLGHASLQATQIYTHNSIARLREVYSKAHPREKDG